MAGDKALASLGARLGRVEGQVRGVRRMIEAHEELHDVVTQINAAISALEATALALMAIRVEQACLRADLSPDHSAEVAKAARNMTSKMMRRR